jgi:hypothetical protein
MKTEIYDSMLNDLPSEEKVDLIHSLLLEANDAHIDLDNGSDQIKALGRLAQAKRVIQALEDEYINMAI